MTRTAAVALAFCFAVTPAARADDDDVAVKEKLDLVAVLDKGVDPNTPLKDVLDYFSDRGGLSRPTPMSRS